MKKKMATAVLTKHGYKVVGRLGQGQYGVVHELAGGLAAKVPLRGTICQTMSTEFDALVRVYGLAPTGVVRPVALLEDRGRSILIMAKAGRPVKLLQPDAALGIYLVSMAQWLSAANLAYLDMHFSNILWDEQTGFRLCDIDPAFLLSAPAVEAELMSLYLALHRCCKHALAAAPVAKRLAELMDTAGINMHDLLKRLRSYELFRTFQAHLNIRASPLQKLLPQPYALRSATVALAPLNQ